MRRFDLLAKLQLDLNNRGSGNMSEIWTSIVSAATSISTIIALAALVAALMAMVAILLYTQHTKTQVQLLKSLPPKDRAAQLPAVLRGLPFSPETLTEKSQAQLTLIILKHSFWLKVVFVISALLITLSLALLALRQPPLPWQAAAFEVQEHAVNWDLSQWKPFSDNSNEITKAKNQITLVKVRSDVTHFTTRIGTTSPIDPTISDASTSWVMREIKDTGAHSARTWQAAFDIERFPQMTEIPLSYSVNYHNAFQGQSIEWVGFTTIHPTRKLILSVTFPKHKPMKSVQIYTYPRNDKNKKSFGDPTQLTLKSPHDVIWEIAFPRLNWNYVIEWGW